MAGTEITIPCKDGSMTGYLSMPKSGTGPGVVVMQEIFGVNQVMREITDMFAAEGFVALCPDLFWRIEPGVNITDKSKAEWDKAFALFGKQQSDGHPGSIHEPSAVLNPPTPAGLGTLGPRGRAVGPRHSCPRPRRLDPVRRPPTRGTA